MYISDEVITDIVLQVFHICQSGGQMDSFLCPNGTIFNQRYLVCDWYYNVDCSQAEGLWRETNEAVVNAMREADERLAQEKQQQAGGYDANAQSNDRRGGSNGGYQYESSNGQRGQNGNAPSTFGAPSNGASSFGNRNGGAPSQTYGAPNGNGNSRNGNGNGNNRSGNGGNRNGNGGSAATPSAQYGAPATGSGNGNNRQSSNGNRQSGNGNGSNGNGNGFSSNNRAGSAPSTQYGAPANGNGNGIVF